MIASCPWCEGRGKRLGPVFEKRSNSIGVAIQLESITCERCNGSGVIEYLPVLKNQSIKLEEKK